MPEIRNEAHIKCKVLSNALIVPGVRAMIEEPVPVDYVFVTGKAVVELDGSSEKQITFNCGFVPRMVYLIGYPYYSWNQKYTSYSIYYTRYTTVAYVCDLAKLKISGRLTYYMTTKQSNQSNTNYSNRSVDVDADITFDANEDGSITIHIPSTGTGASYIKEGAELTFYAGYTNESPEAYDVGYGEGEETGYQKGHDEGWEAGYQHGVEAGMEENKYDGVYVVTPLADEEQVLETSKKYLEENVTVRQIPYYDTSNNAGGRTIYIGTEV